MTIKITYNFSYHRLFAVAVIFLQLKNVSGQQKDFQGIVGLGLEKKISPSFSFTLYNQELFNQNLAELGSGFIDAGITYKLNRNLSFGASYRFVQQRDLNNIYQARQMIYGDVTCSKGFKKFSASLRARIQNSYYPLVINETKQTSIAYNRDRLTIRYRYNYYFAPFVYGELWYPVNHPTHDKVDRVRGALGFYYTFNEHFKTELYYSITQELNHSNKKTNYAIGIASYFRI
ncbi:MAG TPA: DUF2490 domain-containing protein [Chitinophagales bacterium]|nr:DUF2490 domain-containing protein [Chitinophagales bacterium]